MSTDIPIYQIKITLQDIQPPIWRRVLVSGAMTPADLHHVIQVVFGWWNYHLHEFIVGDVHYGMADLDDDFMQTSDENQVQLHQIIPGAGFVFHYAYDFGDDWQHEVLVEELLPPDPAQQLPLCLGGERSRPPEDVGGIWGFADFLEAMADPENPEHDEYVEWIGGQFDPEAFDLDAVNADLA
jgi:hypothetical protein